ncbi:MAG: hypothetical protein WC849_01930 [Candidatus Paceibacterota bacterium]
MDIRNIVLDKIKEIQTRKPKSNFVWDGSLYQDIQRLTLDDKGQLGEEITVDILRSFNCNIIFDSSITDKVKGHDLISNDLKIEVKLATITVGSGLFQHDNLHPQRDFNAVLFIDIAPNEIYLTAVHKGDFVWKDMTRRENGLYKYDFSIKHIKNKNIPKLKKYKTGLVNSTQDFFDVYKWLEKSDK